MLCPSCNTENPVNTMYCMNCGANLQNTEAGSVTAANPAGHAIYIATGQTLVAVIMLFLLRSILTGLSFVREIQIPDWRITVPDIISIVMYLLVLLVLLNYARLLGYHWPRAFPRYVGIGMVLTAILYLIALSVTYSMLKPLFFQFFSDPEPILILRVFLALIAIFLVGRAALVVYHSTPIWLDNLRASFVTSPYPGDKK